MSTRAVYTFKNADEAHHVYKHCDGYPTGAAGAIANALKLAWELPRFEPDEFGAAFIAANKRNSGGLRLTHGPEHHKDIEYKYEITVEGQALMVTCYERDRDWDNPTWTLFYPEPLPLILFIYEARVRALENQGVTRSDAQAAVDAEDAEDMKK